MFLQATWIVMSCTCTHKKRHTASRTKMGWICFFQSLFTLKENMFISADPIWCLYFNSTFISPGLSIMKRAASCCPHSFVHSVINSDLKSALPPSDSPFPCASADEARRDTARLDPVFFPQRKGISTGLLLTTSTRGGSGSMQQRAGDHFGPLNYNQ